MKIDFSSENKSKYDDQYPKLKLEHNERARVCIVEPQPTAGFLHTLKAPQVMEGQVVMKPVKQKDGTYKEMVVEDFIGRHLCFGNLNVLAEKGKDLDNCPTCQKAQESDAIGGATRAFAVHVIRYKIQHGGFIPQSPFGADLVAWRFADKVFNSLVDIATEHGGDLRKKDLLLGPCENVNFQKYDINVGSDAHWLGSPENLEYVKALYANNKSEDLTPLISRKVTREQAMEDVSKVLHRHAIINGTASTTHAPMGAAAVSQSMDLDTMLSGGGDPLSGPAAAAPAADPTPAPTPSAPMEDPWATPTPTPSPDLPAAPAEPAPTPAAPAADPLDFDSLLDGL